MSDTPSGTSPPGTDAGGGSGGQQPSEEEVRAYLSQLRSAPADQVLAEVLSSLLNAAQVKLGRRDARLLIDVTAAAVDAGRDRLPAELSRQVDQALSQLRLAQVEAEQEVAKQGREEPSDLSAAQAGDDTGAATAGDQPPAGSQPAGETGASRSEPAPGAPGSAASRLWIPGR